MKTSFIASYDYGSGGVLYRLFATSIDEVECLFPPPKWQVFSEGGDGCPELSADSRITESDVDRREDWLVKHVWTQNQQDLGRRPCWFEHPNKFKTRYFEVWATSEKNVLHRFPELRSMALRTMTAEMLDGITYCTLDELQDHL